QRSREEQRDVRMRDVDWDDFDATRKPHGLLLEDEPAPRSGCAPRLPLIIIAVAALLVIIVVALIVVLSGGGTSKSKPSAARHAKSAEQSASTAPLPTLSNRPLQYTMTSSTGSSTSGGSSTYTATLRPGTASGQFIETEMYPNSQQITNELFSSSGVEASSVTTSSPTVTNTFQ